MIFSQVGSSGKEVIREGTIHYHKVSKSSTITKPAQKIIQPARNTLSLQLRTFVCQDRWLQWGKCVLARRNQVSIFDQCLTGRFCSGINQSIQSYSVLPGREYEANAGLCSVWASSGLYWSHMYIPKPQLSSSPKFLSLKYFSLQSYHRFSTGSSVDLGHSAASASSGAASVDAGSASTGDLRSRRSVSESMSLDSTPWLEIDPSIYWYFPKQS